MSGLRYLNGVLTVIALLLAGILFVGVSERSEKGSFDVVKTAYAAENEFGEEPNFMFYPVGNQGVRRLVFWDRTNNVIYDYKSGGDLDNTWKLISLGEKLEKN